MAKNRRILNTVLAAGVAGTSIAGYSAVGLPVAAKQAGVTATVTKGVVLSSVSSTGNALAVAQSAINFVTGGTVTEIDVVTGQHVNAGDVLAKLDGASQQVALTAAQATLKSAQDRLALDGGGATDLVVAQDNAAAQQAAVAVSAATTALANARLNAAQDARTLLLSIDQAQQVLANTQTNTAADTATQAALVAAAQAQADQAQAGSDPARTSQANAALANALAAQTSAMQKDQQTLQGAQNTVTNAMNAQVGGALKDSQAVAAAQQALTGAAASRQSTIAANAAKEAPVPGTVAGDQAAVANAVQAVATGVANLAGTVLTAPSSGTIATITGKVGQALTSNTSSSATPSTSGGSGSGGASSTSTTGTAGTGFMTLVDLASMQVVAGFSEIDAVKLKIGQPATLNLAALPGQSMQGTVTAIDTNSTVVSNVVTYNAVIAVVQPPPGLKPGMTATVAVTTAEKDDVLQLAASALTVRRSSATVQVLQADGTTVTKTVTIGMRGDSANEILSGVNVGDKVVVPVANAVTGGGARTATANTGGGLGGGGLGGGGTGGSGGSGRGGG